MHIAFLNVQGNFDPQDRYWTAHPDFGGQLVYVKEVSLALGRLGHRVDILTRQIVDPEWPGFESRFDAYPGAPNVRIVRLPCGGDRFLPKQALWPHLATEWVTNIEQFYASEGSSPDAATSHYGDSGLAAAVWQARGGPRYTFTAHSLGAHKLERLLVYNHTDLAALDAEYHFARRIAAERVAASRAARVITSTRQERVDQYSHAAYRDAVDPADDSRFAIVPPGVNIEVFDEFRSTPDDAGVARHVENVLERDVEPGRRELPVVICSSRLEPKKNHVGLVLAFGRSPELQAAANLLLVVRGTEDIRHAMALHESEQTVMNEIVDACETHGLWGKVAAISLEGQGELAAAYRHLASRGSVFALTALYEPFGLAPLEAAAAGLPVVVTRNGGPSESLYDERTATEFGVLVDPADPGDIARGLLRLLGRGDEWQRFRQAGHERVLAHYTWARTAEGYLDTLSAVLSEPESGTRRSALPIPTFFVDPRPENDLGLDQLKTIFGHGR